MLAGPLDYHHGGMRNVLPEHYQFRDVAPPVQGTRGHQLAMYVVYQNHLPMMVDYPEAYRGEPGLKFLVQVPTNWDETRVLHAEFGKCLVIARRKGDDWYLGGMTASEERKLDLPLDFLSRRSYEAELYLDQPVGGPTSVALRKQRLSAADTLSVVIPRSGGFAARLAGSLSE
jgi:alpha-glucosidase